MYPLEVLVLIIIACHAAIVSCCQLRCRDAACGPAGQQGRASRADDRVRWWVFLFCDEALDHAVSFQILSP